MMKRLWFLLITTTLAFTSCQSNHYEKSIAFENNNWIKFNELEFDIPVETGKKYEFYGDLITDSTFNRRKIEVGFYLTLPGGEERLSDHNIRILDFEYQPLGKKTSKGYVLPINFQKIISASSTGNLHLNLVLHSQYYDNFGIREFKIIVKEK